VNGSLWIDFAHWHRTNPHVWPLFVRYAFEAINAGRKRFSARAIIHRIRWHENVELRAVDEFKINNNWSPYYGRIFCEVYPQHSGLFALREVEDHPSVRQELAAEMRDQLNRHWGGYSNG
jgi:hypothetical protein